MTKFGAMTKGTVSEAGIEDDESGKIVPVFLKELTDINPESVFKIIS